MSDDSYDCDHEEVRCSQTQSLVLHVACTRNSFHLPMQFRGAHHALGDPSLNAVGSVCVSVTLFMSGGCELVACAMFHHGNWLLGECRCTLSCKMFKLPTILLSSSKQMMICTLGKLCLHQAIPCTLCMTHE